MDAISLLYSGFPRSCNNQPSTADRERLGGQRMRNVISKLMDAALRLLWQLGSSNNGGTKW